MMANTPDGRAVRVKRLKTGDHFGYDALLAATHDTTVSCLSEVELTAVPQEELRLASDQDGYLGETMQAQRSKREAALQAAVEQQEEAQILPMMAKAAVKGDGVEYDKYEAMIAQMHKVSFKSDDCVFRQGDPATAGARSRMGPRMRTRALPACELSALVCAGARPRLYARRGTLAGGSRFPLATRRL